MSEPDYWRDEARRALLALRESRAEVEQLTELWQSWQRRAADLQSEKYNLELNLRAENEKLKAELANERLHANYIGSHT